jgi:hypothetical protein
MIVNLLLWAFFASYLVHIIDEMLSNGGFVQWVIANFWPTYRMRMFFWFNAGAIAAVAFSNVMFDALGGHWIILPLIWVAGFVTHAATFHLYWTIRRNDYSPGLATSLLYIVVLYLLVKYGVGGRLIATSDFVTGVVIGVATVGTFLTFGPTVLFPRLMKARR